MTDNQQWQAPVPSASVPPAPAAFVPPPPAGYVTASPIAAFAAQPGAIGWTPPPKPGLIPLRPLSLGTILGAPFRMMRNNPRPTLGLALVVQGIILVISGAIVAAIYFSTFSRLDYSSETDDQLALQAGAIASLYLALLVPVLLSVIGSAFVQAFVVLAVARGSVGERLRFGQLWKLAKGRVGALIGWAFLIILFAVVIYVVFIVLVVLAVAIGSGALAAGIVLGILFFLATVALGIWLAVKLSLVTCAIVIERMSVGRAMARSWRLTTGYVPFWRTLGIEALVGAILGFVSNIINVPLQVMLQFLVPLLDPNGQTTTSPSGLIIGVAIFTGVAYLVVSAVALVIVSATVALLYIDLRMRKEGLDLELARFAEARSAGDDSVADPYIRVATA